MVYACSKMPEISQIWKIYRLIGNWDRNERTWRHEIFREV